MSSEKLSVIIFLCNFANILFILNCKDVMIKRFAVLCAVYVLFMLCGYGQNGVGGYPLSAFEQMIPKPNEIRVNLPDSAMMAIRKDTVNEKWNNRIGIVVQTDINLMRDGLWSKGDRGIGDICRLRLSSEGAMALGLKFSNFELPEDGRLFVYNDDMSELLGAFTQGNNGEGDLLTDYILGSSVVVEFNGRAEDWNNIKIDEVIYFYRGVESSGSCQVNVQCPEGDLYREQIKSVVKLECRVKNSIYHCSGTLINNSRTDRTPYILTAFHCAHNDSGAETTAEEYNDWRFVFNYQRKNCMGEEVQPHHAMYGAKRIASSDWKNSVEIGSDFLLLKLNEMIPADLDVYYSGWDRSGIPENDGVSIHHPRGDYKKISTFKNSLVQTNFPNGGDPMSFWKVRWAKTANGFGVTEGGSSGAGLFNNRGSLIGTLTGGTSSCSYTAGDDYFGMFSKSWASNGSSSDKQLAPWLDPIGSGTYKLSGLHTIGVKKIESDNDNVHVYPNPAKEYIVIELPESIGYKKVSLLDVTGRELMVNDEQPYDNKLMIDIRGVRSGVCFVRVDFENYYKTVKIIINCE